MMRPADLARGQRFSDRQQAGMVLAQSLLRFSNRLDVVVLGLPRGGIPVAFEVARTLRAPLDVMVVRKLGLPMQPELAMGAIASGGVRVLNDDVMASYRPSEAMLDAVTQAEQHELVRRERAYRGGRRPVPIEGKTVILVDDGLATGATMRAAVLAARSLKPLAVVVAVPVGAAETCRALRDVADDVVCVLAPDYFEAVGLWYDDFGQTTDEEVERILSAGTGDDEVRATAGR